MLPQKQDITVGSQKHACCRAVPDRAVRAEEPQKMQRLNMKSSPS